MEKGAHANIVASMESARGQGSIGLVGEKAAQPGPVYDRLVPDWQR